MSKKSSTFAPAFGKTDNPHGPSGRKPAERLRTEERGESVAQQVEHIPFKDGVLGSSPSWFTERESRLSFCFLHPFFFFLSHSHSPFSFLILSNSALQFCLQNYYKKSECANKMNFILPFAGF